MPPPGERIASRPGFASGAGAVFGGFGVIARSPAIWLWALVPTLVLFALEAVAITLAATVARPFIESLLPAASSGLGKFGVGAVGFLATAVLAVFGWFVAVPLAPPLSAPALERIVFHVETELGMPPREPIGFLRELVCGFRAMAGAFAVGLPALALLWLLEFLFPPVAVVTTPAKFLVSSLLVAWGLFDYPLTLRGMGMRARLDLMLENFGCVLGFGLTFTLVFWVPCCGVLLLPVGVAAATRLTAEIHHGEWTNSSAPTSG